MRLLDNLQRRFGRFAVPHVTEGLIACQVLSSYGARASRVPGRHRLVPSRVLQGEVWRLVTFVGQPPHDEPAVGLLLLVLVLPDGHGVGEHVGRVPLQRRICWSAGLATVAVSFLQPDAAASVVFLQGSVFLAFAYLYPDFQILLFFILPVKVKWLALLQWIGYFYVMLFGDLMTQLMVVASVCNFVLFFWHDIFLR